MNKNRKLRIAFVTPEYSTEQNFDGGLANYLGRLCPALARMGHEAVVLVSTFRQEFFVSEGVEIVRVAPSRRFFSWLDRMTRRRLSTACWWVWQSWTLNRTCAAVHQSKPFDLIQYASYTATGLFRLVGVPAVVRISSYETTRQQGYELDQTLDRKVMAYLDKTAVRKADAVFGPSCVVADQVRRETGCNVSVIESPYFPPNKPLDEQPYRELLSKKKYLLFYGTLGVLKGVLTIAETLPQLLSNHKDLYFVFIGKDGGHGGRPMMQHVWKKAGSFRGRVLYLGAMRRQRLQPFVENALAVVLPSRVDNLPNTCIEAMSARRIVIGTWGASFEQLIEDGKSGFLVDPQQPAELLATMEKVLALGHDKRKEMGQKAAQATDRLKGEKAVERLVEYYWTVVGGKGL
jgi:glycosyltransferase involved in cell wall biosynthesis